MLLFWPRSLSQALSVAQEELTHFNEKILMHESSSERLKTKFRELLATIDSMVDKGESKERLVRGLLRR